MNSLHDSARKHVSGESVYVDDIPVNDQLLHGYVVYSPHAHAKIVSYDLSGARALPGVHAVLSAADIPGHNQMGPVIKDEPALAEKEVHCVGQAVFLIAAESEDFARKAAAKIKVEYQPLPSILTIPQAMEKNNLLGPERKIIYGDVADGFAKSDHIIEGTLTTGAQEHWYLETQVSLCVPGEDNEMKVYSSSQHPSETQALVAEVLGIQRNEVEVEVRRMGGAFGGKETQANHTACWTALLARATGRPVKIRLFRDDDQKITGKRHPYLINYKVGFHDDGRITAMEVQLNSNGGWATDLSFAILERAMLHAENAYYIPNMAITGRVWKTNLPSNTAFRGFGGPQGIAGMETVIDRIARKLGKDAADIRARNFYGQGKNDITPYGQTVEHNHLQLIYEQLIKSSQYQERREAINTFNASSEFIKRGMAMTPVKFGISFTTSFLNQAGALVHIYQDGTVMVNHGGTEMGQGLHTKIAQIAAAELGIPLERIRVTATNTSKVPNTSATAASSGTDLNGMAVKNAIDILKKRIAAVVSGVFNQSGGDACTPDDFVFSNEEIVHRCNPVRAMKFTEAVQKAYLSQISLSSTGYYRTPDIGWDRDAGRGRPFHYFSFGMAVSEVEVDTLTGAHRVLRADLLHDVGDSLNSGIDIGQVEGGYVQGLGWCTTEECKWDENGNLLNHSPDTYKIPTIADIPLDFRTELLSGVPNPLAIRRSKAIAEPPFMLGLSAWLAIKDAISAVANHEVEPEFELPATNEVIIKSAAQLAQTKPSV
jgi:xanthine dehydrogenase large subunit